MQIIANSTRTTQAVVESLWRRVVEDATGVSESPLHRYTKSKPDSRFWLGLLFPESQIYLPDRSASLAERFTPAAQGFSFRVSSFPVELEVTASFTIWVALHPSLEEQRAGAGLEEEDDDGPEATGRTGSDQGLKLARVRMKVPVEDVRFTVKIEGPGECTVGIPELSEAIRRSFDALPADTTLHRPLKGGGRLPRQDDVFDKSSWRNWETDNLLQPARPSWQVAVDVEVDELVGGRADVLVTMVNRSPDRDHQFVDQDRTKKFATWACDPNIYEARLSCKPSVPVVPYELAQIPDSYRYNREVAALGMNAAVEEQNGTLHTAFAAVARTDRVYPRTEADDGTRIDTRFATLRTGPIPALENLVEQSRRWAEEHWGRPALDKMASDGEWAPDVRTQAEEDSREVFREVRWVEEGVELLREDDNLLQAFVLMNETMEIVADDRYDAWYPFQLAYILGCLSGVKDSGAARTVDILWFSTGGGKTEAYLGLNVLGLFYGRLTGRTSGAQTWARFPLRLLSLQQTQRIADSVIAAEVVRRRHRELREGDPLAVGYYVGSGNTPNRIQRQNSSWRDGWNPFEERNADSCRVLEKCPACRHDKKPIVEFNQEAWTMEHKCSNPSCEFHHERLPIFVVDDDVYRWAPSVVVGTVDKLAQIGMQASFRTLFGDARLYCPKHGYSASARYCGVFGCKETLRAVGRGFGGIDFEIQDELHLLNESLGALDGNYETLFQAIAKELGTNAVRIIGATATIEGYKEQSDQLYRRTARRFPIPGPTKAESFWAYEKEDDPLRTFVAMLPRGKTMLDAGFLVTKSHWQFVEEGLQDATAFCRRTPGLNPEQAGEISEILRSYFETMVSYALRKQDLERYAKDIAEDPEVCSGIGNYDMITGDVKDIRPVLDRLTDPPVDPAKRIRVLGATSAISHGVDVNRLNAMTVMGMPQQTSEFIQSTARVGRSHPAVVFCLINPMRERDVSHFRYFRKYAEYLDRLVEPVPVNRESLPVLKRVLPGGLMTLLLQVYEARWLFPDGKVSKKRRDRLYWVKGMAAALDEGFLNESMLVDDLLRAFSVDEHDPQFADHREAVQRFVRTNIENFLSRRGPGTSTSEEMEPPPPRSLRDVETPIEIRGEW